MSKIWLITGADAIFHFWQQLSAGGQVPADWQVTVGPGWFDGRHARHAALNSMICEPDTRHSLWTIDCNIPRASLKKTALD
jgi:uncharacterized protein YbdZ (MbtH family)